MLTRGRDRVQQALIQPCFIRLQRCEHPNNNGNNNVRRRGSNGGAARTRSPPQQREQRTSQPRRLAPKTRARVAEIRTKRNGATIPGGSISSTLFPGQLCVTSRRRVQNRGENPPSPSFLVLRRRIVHKPAKNQGSGNVGGMMPPPPPAARAPRIAPIKGSTTTANTTSTSPPTAQFSPVEVAAEVEVAAAVPEEVEIAVPEEVEVAAALPEIMAAPMPIVVEQQPRPRRARRRQNRQMSPQPGTSTPTFFIRTRKCSQRFNGVYSDSSDSSDYND